MDYEEFGDCIDNLKIGLFRQRAANEPERQEERPKLLQCCVSRPIWPRISA